MPATYDKHGINFAYPENWELSEEWGDLGYPLTVSVAKDSAFWSVLIYDEARNSGELCQQALQVMQSEDYIDFESSEVERELAGSRAQGFDLQFYCLDFLVASRILGLEVQGKTLLFQFQAEDRDFEAMTPVFDAMAFSLLQNLGQTAGSESPAE